MKKLFTFVVIFFILFVIIPTAYSENSSLSLINTLPYEITTICTDSSTILVGTLNGFFVSTDHGKHFYEQDEGLSSLHITGVTFYNGKIFLGTRDAGLYVSNDLGKHWDSLADELNCPTISSVLSNGSAIYITSLCTGFHLSRDGGKTWEERNSGLPTVKTTSFIKTQSGRYFLGTKQFGLFYSDTIEGEYKWKNVLSDYTITSLGYLGDYLFVGTTAGLLRGNIGSDNFQKVQFIGGMPYIPSILKVNDKLFVALSNFGLFGTIDGMHFYTVEPGTVSEPTVLFLDSENDMLLAGDMDGNIFSFDISVPYLQCDKHIEIEDIQQGSSRGEDLVPVNLGGGILKGTVNSPYFIKFTDNSFTGAGKLHFTVNTSVLSIGSYTEPINISSNGGDKTVYVSFKVTQPSTVLIKLKIDSPVAYVNEKKVALDVAPFIVKSAGRTLVPVRFISEIFGAEVDWDGNERKVTIKKGPTEHHSPLLIELWISKKTVRVNFKKSKIDVTPIIVPPGRTMVPIRFISETFGGSVQWNGKAREITISYVP